MPELPEVEVVRRGLERWVVGRTIASVQVLHPRAVRRHVAAPGLDPQADFGGLLVGRQIEAVRRRGKYLWLPLDSGDAVLAHLGMSGQLLVQALEAPDEKHLRVRIRFADSEPRDTAAGPGRTAHPAATHPAATHPGAGRELRFVDQRTFGGLSVSLGGAELPAQVAHIAPDPLDPAFDDATFWPALHRRRTGIKRALLDQTVISGVGNIYADESLWRARLHYARPTETLNRPEAARLLSAVREVMHAALAEGGTSFDALYVNVNGESGYFDRSLQAYGRRDEPCSRCGTPIRREPFMNRSSYFCPHCQPRPRRGRW